MACFLVSVWLFGLSCMFTSKWFSSRFRLSCASSYILCDLYNGTEFIRYVFPTYTSHLTFDRIVSLSLQSTICVNCFRPTPLSRKRWAASLLSSSSSGTESLYHTCQITSSDFIPFNSVSRFSGTESSSPFVYCNKACNKWKTAATEKSG